MRMESVCADFHGQFLPLGVGVFHRFVTRYFFHLLVWLKTVRSVAWFPMDLCACGMHCFRDCFGHGMCAPVEVAEVNDHLVADIAFDHWAGDCPHCAFISWVWLV